MSLITDWSAIVGPDLAADTCPEKMSWPRQPYDGPHDETNDQADLSPSQRSRSKRPPRGISLKLRVESHRALDVQYSLAEIIERINSYFGYRAVTDIRIIQGPIQSERVKKKPRPEQIKCQTKGPLADLSTIEDEGLRRALERLDAARRI